MAGRLHGKVAVIMGAGSIAPGIGNGRGAAILFAREGARVFAVDINSDALELTRQAVVAEGGEIECFVADVTDQAAIRAATTRCLEKFGTISVLMNNVGITAAGGATTTPLETWDRILRINLTSAFLSCQEMIPAMVEGGGGSIINVSSNMGSSSRRSMQYLSYSVSKAGLESLTRCIAVEFALSGIRANNLILGPIDAPHVQGSFPDVRAKYGEEEVVRIKAQRDKMTPMGRQGTGWDVANAALFLASDESAYTTGSNIWIDGGLNVVLD